LSASLADRLMAVLFVADRPVNLPTLSAALECEEPELHAEIESLAGRLRVAGPLELVRIAGGWQLSTRPEFAGDLARFLRPQRQRLSRSLMEVLAIVAYRQPLTMSEIDGVRGVQSDYGLRQLLERRFVKEVGRKNTPGRPALYGTTEQFLHAFGLEELKCLPDVGLQALEPGDASALPQSMDRGGDDATLPPASPPALP